MSEAARAVDCEGCCACSNSSRVLSQHGFGEVFDLGQLRWPEIVFSTYDWNALLREGLPLSDSTVVRSGALSGLSDKAHGSQAHRNQWLLIMMALDVHPELFGSFRGSSAELYKEFGGEWLNQWEPKLPWPSDDRRTKYLLFLTQSHPSAWVFLFDYPAVDQSKPGVGDSSNFANAYYFVEVFHRALDVSRED